MHLNTTSSGNYFSYSEDPWSPSPTSHVRIRLIEIAPPEPKPESEAHEDSDILSCHLFWTPLSSPESFKALSYTWGGGNMTQTIKVNGKNFKITESLEIALRHLRQSSSLVMRLWVDQICINQEDDEEKSEQVGHMTRIYQAAEEVLVWLGPAADDSDSFMDVWSTIGKWAEEWGMMTYYTKERIGLLGQIWDNINPQDPKTIEYHSNVAHFITLFTKDVLNAMIYWQRRPWWTRVWVFQEYSLARAVTIVCGGKSITGDQALLARQMFDNSIGGSIENITDFAPDIENDPAQAFFARRQRRQKYDMGAGPGDGLFRLLQNLYSNNNMKATKACDRVYGVLGVATDTSKLGLHPNYTIQERVDLIFSRTARAIIVSGDVDLLTLSQYPKHNRLPSWVPDWEGTIQKSFAFQPAADKPLRFSASGGFPLELIANSDDLVLGIRGFKVDQIEDVAGIWDGGEVDGKIQHQSFVTCLSEIERLCDLSAIKDKNIYPSPERRTEAVWRVPVGDMEDIRLYDTKKDGRATKAMAEAYGDCRKNAEWFEQCGKWSPDIFKAREQELMDSEATKKPGMYRLYMGAMKNKRPFITKDGYVGMGPLQMLPGDLIVVFTGANLPYVVRPVQERNFEFLGECYCDGIMDGEVIERSPIEEFFLV